VAGFSNFKYFPEGSFDKMLSLLFGYQSEGFPDRSNCRPATGRHAEPLTGFGLGAAIAAQFVFEFVEHFRLVARDQIADADDLHLHVFDQT
jgi:hypothetical protein